MKKNPSSISNISIVLILFVLLAWCGCGRGLLPRDTGARTVQFIYRGAAQSVCVRGSFNGWDGHTLCMIEEGGLWAVAARLVPGRYVYELLVDGRPCPDPDAVAQEDDGFGNMNSVLVVP